MQSVSVCVNLRVSMALNVYVRTHMRGCARVCRHASVHQGRMHVSHLGERLCGLGPGMTPRKDTYCTHCSRKDTCSTLSCRACRNPKTCVHGTLHAQQWHATPSKGAPCLPSRCSARAIIVAARCVHNSSTQDAYMARRVCYYGTQCRAHTTMVVASHRCVATHTGPSCWPRLITEAHAQRAASVRQ